jgi:hypothetical protein
MTSCSKVSYRLQKKSGPYVGRSKPESGREIQGQWRTTASKGTYREPVRVKETAKWLQEDICIPREVRSGEKLKRDVDGGTRFFRNIWAFSGLRDVDVERMHRSTFS